VTGLRARGGFAVDIRWKGGRLAGRRGDSLLGGPCRVRYGDQVMQIETRAGERYALP